MHQPYYKDLQTGRLCLPWVRLHGIKDYLDMVKILEKYPKIHQTFNLVPSLIEQINSYIEGGQDTYQEITLKKAGELTPQDKNFLLERFFSAHTVNMISVLPRYYQLYLKKQSKKEFTTQDYLDLQILFNLAWFDPYFKKNIPEIKSLIDKGRNFSEEDKQTVLNKQISVLKEIIPTYKKYQDSGQIEVTISPYYHPITPLLCNTQIAKEADKATHLPRSNFIYPEDAKAQIQEAIKLYNECFGKPPQGMWPSEEAVSEHILPLIIESGIKWIVTDEAILFRSIKKKRAGDNLYKPYCLKREEGESAIIFRDRNLSDLIGFTYHTWPVDDAASDFLRHLQNISVASKNKDCFIVIAMDGENAWEYYKNDGWDFLSRLYKAISEDTNIKTVTVSEYLEINPKKENIKRLSAGSWIYGNFHKWIGSPHKNRAWDYLAKAREELKTAAGNKQLPAEMLAKAWKQMYICEGSDWFWWYGDDNADFDELYRKHLINFYKFIGKEPPEYLHHPI